jgi:hypothetical protein
MAEPITIKKKKKLTIKSRAVKAATPVAAGGQDAGDQVAPPAAVAAVAPAKTPSYTFFAIVALLATLMFIGIVAIQWTEWTFLTPAFPRPIQTGPIIPN